MHWIAIILIAPVFGAVSYYFFADPTRIDTLDKWQVFLAACVAMGGAALAYGAAIAKVKSDERSELRKLNEKKMIHVNTILIEAGRIGATSRSVYELSTVLNDQPKFCLDRWKADANLQEFRRSFELIIDMMAPKYQLACNKLISSAQQFEQKLRACAEEKIEFGIDMHPNDLAALLGNCQKIERNRDWIERFYFEASDRLQGKKCLMCGRVVRQVRRWRQRRLLATNTAEPKTKES